MDKSRGEGKQQAPELKIGDPFRFFERQAWEVRKKLDLPMEFVPEALAILQNAFGEDWLRRQVETTTRRSPIPFHVHPLGGCLGVAGESQIVEVLELAVYLKRLFDVPAIVNVLHDMKTKYAHGFLQLAFAYRLRRVGATEMRLEPSAARGRKADIFFEIDRHAYLVECYIPRQQRRDSMPEMHHVVGPISKALGQQLRRVRIYLQRTVTAVDRKRIQGKVIRAIRESSEQAGITIDDEAARIVIERFSLEGGDPDYPNPAFAKPEGPYGDADFAARFTSVSAKDIPAVRLGVPKANVFGRLFVWRPAVEEVAPPLEERVSYLADKLSDKLAQTHREDMPRRILIVLIPEGDDRSDDTVQFVHEVGRRLVGKHDLIAGMFLLRRVWLVKGRFQYRGYFLGGKEDSRLPSEVFQRVYQIEQDEDILQDWK